jgi:signal transduction histidine kinase
MPIGSSAKVQGVAVFASRFPNNYRPEHLALLRNLGVLVGVSLARTIQLFESARLANIGQFASGIVHEIRNPLATINLALEHLKGLAELPASTHKRIDLADNEVRRLERLLDDILLYAKPLTIDRRTLDINVLIADVIGAMAKDPTPIAFRPEPCPEVSADPDRIRQVLINLLSNAQQASPVGPPVQIRCRPIDGHRIEVEIQNNGDPIPENALARIFEPFYTSKPGGTGLGLPIVQRIVDAHGGHITLESDAQHGTRARLTLPVVSEAIAA